MSPTEDLNPLLNDHSNCIVGLAPDAPHILWAHAEELLGVLNTLARRQFHARMPDRRPTGALKAVHGLLKAGYTREQIRAVIEDRVRRWQPDLVMREYLRPETLFRTSKFESYLGQVSVPAPSVSKPEPGRASQAAPPVDAPAPEGVECPPEVRVMLERLCGGARFSFPADQQGQA